MPNDLLNWLVERRSVRRYLPDPVPPAQVEQLLAAASWAPSAHNRQPWRFAVVTDGVSKSQLATAMGQRLRADLRADQVAANVIEKDVSHSYQRITQAPLLILLCLTMRDMDHYPEAMRQQREWTMAVQSVAMAGQNLLLAAHALGLAACWMCAPLFCPGVVRQTLDLPADWEPQGLITVGYPAERRQKSRRPLADLVCYVQKSENT